MVSGTESVCSSFGVLIFGFLAFVFREAFSEANFPSKTFKDPSYDTCLPCYFFLLI
jgi:hypothetical protein